MDKEEYKEEAIVKSEKKGQLIEIKNLIVSPIPMKRIALGEVVGLVNMIEQRKSNVSAIFWNENEISLLLNDGDTEISFQPQFDQSTIMFFNREEKRRDTMDDDFGKRIWEGEFEPIQFTKRNLLKFLDKYSEYFDDSVKDAIKNLRIHKKTDSSSEMLSLDDESERTIEEVSESTNLPRTFSAVMPLFDNLKVELHFEAKVKPKDRDEKAKIIELRCTNAKEALRDAMNMVLERMPGDVPKYYGNLRTIRESKSRWF